MRVPKPSFVKMKYEVLQLYSNGHSFFYSEIRNYTVVPKRPFVFHSKIRNLELRPNCHSFFNYEIEIFKIVPKRSFAF